MIAGRRIAAAVAIVGAVVGLASSPAAADPPGPTDYETTIISIEPPLPDGVTVAIAGGDSFVVLAVAPGVRVEVPGYQGEPYLVFEPDGAVQRNERSPSRWYNDDRYGAAEAPPEADAEAEPEWQQVADGGRYAWHDHRAHWMNEVKPPGKAPGDVVLEAVIPIDVDGTTVEIEVRSVLLAPPSPLPALAGAVIAAATVIVAASPRRPWALPAAVTGWAGAATVMGMWDWATVPAESEPTITLWLPSLLAVAAGVAATVVAARPPAPGLPPLKAARRGLLLTVAMAACGIELLVWSALRRAAVTSALIPGTAPEALDRAVVVGAAVAGTAALFSAVYRVVRPVPGRDGDSVTTVPAS